MEQQPVSAIVARLGLWEYPDALDWSGRCKACQGPMDRGGAACKRCVRKMWVKTGIGGVIAMEMVVAAAYAYYRTQPQHPSVVVEDTASYTPPPVLAPNGPTGWLYYETKDSLLGDVTHHARLLSNKPLGYADAKPVAGAVTGTLELADSARYGRTVVLSLPLLKAACDANPCSLRASFDLSEPEVFPFQDISDDRHRILAIGDYDRFTKRLARAHDMTVTASLGTDQDTMVSFTVSGYRMALARMVRWASSLLWALG